MPVLPYKISLTLANLAHLILVDEDLMATNRGSLQDNPLFAAVATHIQHARAVRARATPRACDQQGGGRQGGCECRAAGRTCALSWCSVCCRNREGGIRAESGSPSVPCALRQLCQRGNTNDTGCMSGCVHGSGRGLQARLIDCLPHPRLAVG